MPFTRTFFLFLILHSLAHAHETDFDGGTPLDTYYEVPTYSSGGLSSPESWGLDPKVLDYIRTLEQVREDGGSDSGHSGGGGTFLKCKDAKQLFFWDLRLECSEGNERTEPRGDRISLVNKAQKAGGDWVDYRSLRSYKFLLDRLEYWQKWAPNFVKLIRDTDKRNMKWLATSLNIQSINEIQSHTWKKYEARVAVPGAFYDYSNGLIYVDIKVWNEAGLHSQAAMILHELLRVSQQRYDLKNSIIQDVVYKVITENPTWERVLSGNGYYCGLFNDDHFHPGNADRRVPALTYQNPARPMTVRKTIYQAVSQGILGIYPTIQVPKTSGAFKDLPKPPPAHETDAPPCDRYSD